MFKKIILQLLSFSMVVGLMTAKHWEVKAIEEENVVKQETFILSEDESLREESIKYFTLNAKTKQAIVYSMPVHYKDNGKWKEIDNTLIDDGLEEPDDEQVVGYKNKEGKYKIKISKKVHKSNMISFSDGEYKVTWGFKDFTNKSNGILNKIKKDSNEIERVLDNINQELIYKDVLNGIDLVYNIDSLSIKENIVINKKQDINTFSFEYKTNKIDLVLNNNGEIEAINEDGEAIFMMPKPFMYDNDGNYCEDVYYEITEKNKKYTITIVANKDWMNEESRVYPITIDPVIITETSKSAIDTTFVTSKQASTNYSTKLELLVGKESSEYGNCRTLVKFDLPTLNRGDMIVAAELNIASYKNGFYSSGTPDLRINAHMANSSWAYNTVTWNTCPTYETGVLDYDYIKRSDTAGTANWKVFDITRAVKKWYNDTTNNGILLKSYDENGSYANTGVKGYLWPERYNSTTAAYPYIALTYRNNKGLEDYWNFSSISTASAGNVYINDYSGNLVVSHTDASTNGTKMPMVISHIYNGYMAGSNIISKPYVGKGWKLNIQQTVRSSNLYGLTGESATTFPYVYMDEDGTEHYFMKVDNKYLDEDGLGYELVKTSSGYTISDKSENVMTFNSSGNITKVTDSNGNSITYTYSGDVISKVTDGNNQSLLLTYDSNNYLTKITDHAQRVTQFTYSNGLLTKITYNDGKVSQYTYDSENSLSSMTSFDGTSIHFSYTSLASGKKVSQIVEKGTNSVLGQTVKFNRVEYNMTKITTSGIDYTIGTSDDITTVMQFDDAGRLFSRYAYTSNKDLGSEAIEYTSSVPNSSGSNISQLNKLTKLGSLSKTTENLLVNHSCESTGSWSYSQSVEPSTFTFVSTDEERLYGQKSFKIDVTANSVLGRSRFNQDLNTTYIKTNTTYTLSAYVKTKNVTKVAGAEDYGATLIAYINSSVLSGTGDYYSEYITGTTDEKINDGWRRISVTFTTPSSFNYLRINAMIKGATGIAYFDALQLEEGEVASPYNMVENSSFERNTNSLPNSWTLYNMGSSDYIRTNNSKHGTYAFAILPEAQKKKEIYQTIPVNGKEEDTYIVSAWGYGKGLIHSDSNRQFKIGIRVHYSDGTIKYKDPSPYNESIYGYKYNAKTFDLSDGTSSVKTPVAVTIFLRSYYQANWIYYDHVQLLKSDVALNQYDDEGNLISSNDGTYTYDSKGNMLTSKDKEGNTITYTYNDKNDITSITSESGIKNELSYDQYGNAESEVITGRNNGDKIKVETEYDTTGSYVLKDTDEDGRTTIYDYDVNKGLLNSVTDSKGNTTSYTYNNSEQLTSVTSGNMSNTITYNEKGRVETINSASSEYYFSYDDFGNRLTTTVGTNILSSVSYADYNGDIVDQLYGNGYNKTYTYDEYGNLATVKSERTLTTKNVYDSLGNLIVVYDFKTNQKTKYDYDLKGRVIGIHTFQLSNDSMDDRDLRLYGMEYGYDEYDHLIREVSYIGNTRKTTDYSYGIEDHVDKVTLDNSKSINYSYDSLDRITNKSINTISPIEVTYEYTDSLRGEEYTTTKIHKETVGGIEYTYTYDEIGNITNIAINNDNNIKNISYTYDSNSQLTREDNQQLNKTIVYEYDNSGNMLSKKEYAYTTGEVGTPIDTVIYAYENEGWKDQLTSYNGQTITYDIIGNPLSYKGYNMTWSGRELLSMSNGNDTISYIYDNNGIRKNKTVNGITTTYDYIGNVLVHETRNNSELYYTYDDAGSLAKITYVNNGVSTDYYVSSNSRGDIEGIYNAQGVLQARYIYDTWGNTVSVSDSNGNEITDPNHIGHINPIRYRGYYLDNETGFYYLLSRYYDAEVMRFINADSQLNDSVGLLGYNMYVYCNNNPVAFSDSTGHLPFFAITAVIGATIGAIVGAVKASQSEESVLEGVVKGSLVGGLVGLGVGMVSGVMLTGSIGASTTAVAAGAKVLNSYVASGGISAGITYVANNISGCGQSAATLQQVTQRGKIGEAISGITKNTTRIYDSLVSGAKYRIPDGLTSTTLSEVKNYSGTLSYTAQLRDFVSYSQAHGLKMHLYTNARLSGPLQEIVDSGIIQVFPLK